MVTPSVTDLMFDALTKRYPTDPREMSFLLKHFEADQPGFSRANWAQRAAFYKGQGISGASVADLEQSYWNSPLSRAVGLWKASTYSGAGSLLDLSGKGHDFALPGGTNNPTFLKYNPADGKYAYLPGVAGNYLSSPDAAALDIVGNLDIRVKVALDDWTPTAIPTLVSKWGASGAFSYVLDVQPTGELSLQWSTDGAGSGAKYSQSTVPTGIADGSVKWVRAALTVNNGSGGWTARFYTSDDGVTWTQLGANVTGAGVTSIFSGSATLNIGALNNGASEFASGKFYVAQVVNSSGTLVFDWRAADMVEPFATVIERSVNAATVTANRTASGKKLAVVDRSLFLFGTDDYLETPNHADFNFSLTDSMTAIVIARRWGPSGGEEVFIAKKTGSGTSGAVGWGILMSGTSGYASWSDGTVGSNTSLGVPGDGVARQYGIRRNVSADQISSLLGSTAISTTTDTSTVTWLNTENPRIGRWTGVSSGQSNMEFIAAAVFREALSTADLANAQAELVRAGI